LLLQIGKLLIDYGIPLPEVDVNEFNALPEYDLNQAATLRSKLNVQQMNLANSVIDSIVSPNKFRPTVYYLDGPGGSCRAT